MVTISRWLLFNWPPKWCHMKLSMDSQLLHLHHIIRAAPWWHKLGTIYVLMMLFNVFSRTILPWLRIEWRSKQININHSSMKWMPCFNGPFKVFEREGPVEYKLKLPKGSKAHHVLSCFTLKKDAGFYSCYCTRSSSYDKWVTCQEEPIVMLDCCMVKHHNSALMEVLIQ